MMKIFLMGVMLVLAACTTNKKEAKFSVTASFGGSYYKDTVEYAFIVGKLHNLSDDTLSFLSMTCSWDDAWHISSPNLATESNLCYSNVPMLVKLWPHESILNYVPVKLLKPYHDIKDEKFVAGFNLVETDSIEFATSIEAMKKTDNIFWSDTLQLNKLYRFNTIAKEKKCP